MMATNDVGDSKYSQETDAITTYKMVSNNERVVSTGFSWCAIDSNKSP